MKLIDSLGKEISLHRPVNRCCYQQCCTLISFIHFTWQKNLSVLHVGERITDMSVNCSDSLWTFPHTRERGDGVEMFHIIILYFLCSTQRCKLQLMIAIFVWDTLDDISNWNPSDASIKQSNSKLNWRGIIHLLLGVFKGCGFYAVVHSTLHVVVCWDTFKSSTGTLGWYFAFFFLHGKSIVSCLLWQWKKNSCYLSSLESVICVHILTRSTYTHVKLLI